MPSDLLHRRRPLDPTRPEPVALPRPGYLRVKALTGFVDSDGRVHWPDDGAIDDLPETDRRVVIIENRWAEAVEVAE
jgi:hypothetical protein